MFLLITGSLFFYAFTSIPGLLILLGLILVNYFSGLYIANSPNKNLLLVVSCGINLSALFIFKYYNFFFSEINSVFALAGMEVNIPMLHWVMPLGISYSVLQAIGYNTDIQREMQEPEKNFLVFANYFLFFPKALQGPVDRPRLLMPQFHNIPSFNYSRVIGGLLLITWGLFKKLVIADRLGIFVNEIYGNSHDYSGSIFLLAGLFYTFQLYADFSGYMDIAIGTAEILGFTMFRNFNKPFAATSVTDFWKRWHISLSTWLYEYIFNPISLLKRDWGLWGMGYAIFITFLISGLWHGASWIFIFWGMINGIALGYELVTSKWRKKLFKKLNKNAARNISIAITFIFTILSFTFARSNSLEDAYYIFTSILNFNSPSSISDSGFVSLNLGLGIAGVVLLLLMHWWQNMPDWRKVIQEQALLVRWSVYCIAILIIINFGILSGSGFIYAQF
ncbi:MAG: MBOAT family protein [Bacteroidetes bacterium]|nr:MBOAT family protein [Bacteroidota bacterium]